MIMIISSQDLLQRFTGLFPDFPYSRFTSGFLVDCTTRRLISGSSSLSHLRLQKLDLAHLLSSRVLRLATQITVFLLYYQDKELSGSSTLKTMTRQLQAIEDIRCPAALLQRFRKLLICLLLYVGGPAAKTFSAVQSFINALIMKCLTSIIIQPV